MFNAVIRGWVEYYGRYYRSMLYPTFRHLDRLLVWWACRKFKRLRRHRRRAAQWLQRISLREPRLWAHWAIGVRVTV
jgi:RNA-directed DNA polymerase